MSIIGWNLKKMIAANSPLYYSVIRCGGLNHPSIPIHDACKKILEATESV